MAFEKKTVIVSIAVLAMIVAMTVTEVDARTNAEHFGRNLLDSEDDKEVDERRNLYDLVGAMKSPCCNKLVTTCCAPAPAPKPSRKSKASSPKASSPKASSSKSSRTFTPASSSKSSKAPSPKASPSKSSKAPSPKASSSKSPKASTPKASKA